MQKCVLFGSYLYLRHLVVQLLITHILKPVNSNLKVLNTYSANILFIVAETVHNQIGSLMIR